MSIDFDALRQRLMEAIAGGVSPLEVFKEMGIDSNDPSVLQAIMAQAGFDLSNLFPGGQADMAGVIDQLMHNISPENKQQLSQLIKGITGEAGSGSSLPADIQELLKNLQKP